MDKFPSCSVLKAQTFSEESIVNRLLGFVWLDLGRCTWKECQSSHCPCSRVLALLPLTLVTVVAPGLSLTELFFPCNWCGADSGKSLLLLSLVLVFGLPRRDWPRPVWSFLSYKMAFPFFHLQNLSFIHVNILDLLSWNPAMFNGLWFICCVYLDVLHGPHLTSEGSSGSPISSWQVIFIFLVLCCFMCGQQEFQSSHAFRVPARD